MVVLADRVDHVDVFARVRLFGLAGRAQQSGRGCESGLVESMSSGGDGIAVEEEVGVEVEVEGGIGI